MTGIKISDYDYDLPEGRIARFPLPRRDSSKLLVYRDGQISQELFGNLPEVLPPGALLLFNDTKVIRARLIMHKPTGARIEVFCLEPHEPADYERAFSTKGSCSWLCLAGNLKKWKDGPLEIIFSVDGERHTLRAWRGQRIGKELLVRFQWDADITFGQLLERLGRIPIPPYLGRDSEELDNTRYQTVYSRFEGSVAAPTAGLHFTPELLEGMRGAGFGFAQVTLHVGAGTFLPVKEEDIALHVMHTEHFEATLATINTLKEAAGRIIPVGTTSVRTLESLTVLGWRVMRDVSPDTGKVIGQWEAYDIPSGVTGEELLGALALYMEREGLEKIDAATQIMIRPGYNFRLTSGMVTNFHQPRSTLLLLVSAFIGEDWRRVYGYAMEHDFRFLSYGDSSLLLR